jgi:predicted ATPase
MLMLREHIRGWRFYDQLRTERDFAREIASDRHAHASARPRTALISRPALQTIVEIGDAHALNASVADAFPGSSVHVTNSDGWFEVHMQQHGLLRSA